MANTSNNEKWYFTKELLENTPSRKCGFDAHKELSYRQQAANFIQDMGQRLKVSQLCINTAIVYMHRFYVFHSFTNFPWYQMAAASLFLAAKVEEQPRKLEYVIRVANMCRNIKENLDINSEKYVAQSQDLVFNENVLLQTLGFDVAIDHPHTHVVRCCHLVRASKDLAQTSYFMASNSLHLTTMCIQYKPTVVACFCILVACKWSNWEIPLSNEKKEWFKYVDPTVTAELLQQLTEEFLVIFEACPSRLKEKIMAIADNVSHLPTNPPISTPFDQDPKKIIKDDGKHQHPHRPHDNKIGPENDLHKHRSRQHEALTANQHQRERDRNLDRERLPVPQKMSSSNNQSSKVPNLHRPPLDQKMKPHSRPPSMGSSSNSGTNSGYIPGNRVEPRDILREASKDSPFGLANKDFRDPSREHGKDPNIVRNSDLQKRDYLLKPNVQTEMNTLCSYPDNRYNYNVEKQRVEPNGRPKVDPSKLPPVNKHDLIRKPEERKPYLKSETENIKKHLSATIQDKNSTFLNKPMLTTTSQKTKSPFDGDLSKSVLKLNTIHASVPPKPQAFNGSSSENAYINRNPIDNQFLVKKEIREIKEEPSNPIIIKRPSLFSPEQSPPHIKDIRPEKISPLLDKKPDTPVTPAFSPFSSPIAVMRDRNLSTSSSEPELRPVIKKIDQVEGFENIMRDSTIGINKGGSVQDVLDPTLTNSQEVKQDRIHQEKHQPPAIIEQKSIVNGLETTPTIISNLLKQAPTVPHLTAGASAMTTNGSESISLNVVAPVETKPEKEHHHHKSKKKNKEKHKHKDKDRSKEDKEKKKKHKDKERERHKHKDKHQDIPPTLVAEPIKLKIQKDRIQPVSDAPTPCTGLKIKIPKDKIKTENINELTQQSLAPPSQPMGIKLKIPKEKLNNCISLETNSKKRERDKSSPPDPIPTKIPKLSHRDAKQNGRHSYNKVSNGTTIHVSHPTHIYPYSSQTNQNNYLSHPYPTQGGAMPPVMPVDTMMPPPPSNPHMYFYPRMAPPPPSSNLPNMSIPPPNYLYPYYQGYIYPTEYYRQPFPPPTKNMNPPLPTEAPPSSVPPPPPPE